MDYGDSVHGLLLSKIQKAEQELLQLKMDYCRFIFGLSHRSRVLVDGRAFLVRSVDIDSMTRLENGHFSRPAISAVPIDAPETAEPVELGTDWALEKPTGQSRADA